MRFHPLNKKKKLRILTYNRRLLKEICLERIGPLTNFFLIYFSEKKLYSPKRKETSEKYLYVYSEQKSLKNSLMHLFTKNYCNWLLSKTVGLYFWSCFVFRYFIFFLCSTNLWFSCSGRDLYRLWSYYRFLFFSSSERSWYLSQTSFWSYLFFLLYLADESYIIFTKNVYIQNCHLRNSSSLFIIVINILRSLHNWVLRIDWKTFEFYLNITWNQFKVHILDTSRELYFFSKILNFF